MLTKATLVRRRSISRSLFSKFSFFFFYLISSLKIIPLVICTSLVQTAECYEIDYTNMATRRCIVRDISSIYSATSQAV